MEKKKSMAELAEDYFEQVRILDEIIEKYSKDLRKAYNSGDYKKSFELKRKLVIYKDQRDEANITAWKLKNYYNT